MTSSTNEATTVWIIEDDSSYRIELIKILNSSPGVDCQKWFSDCESALEWLKSKQEWAPPHVLLLDINLPGLNGIDAIGLLKAFMPDTQIVMLTILDNVHTIYSALRAGASGYLLKNSPLDKIITAIEEASQGGTLMPAGVADKVLWFFQTDQTRKGYGLTTRETEVLQEMANGYAQKQIADRLRVSPSTVNTHIQNIYVKLHVHSGIEAVSKALREKLIR